MSLKLQCHASSEPGSVEHVSASGKFEPSGLLLLEYELNWEKVGVTIPQPSPSERADDLWQATCFELFLRHDVGTAYCEFNFSPSSQWAAYHFSDYREGRVDMALSAPPQICVHRGQSCLGLRARINLPRKYLSGILWAGFSAIVAHDSSETSYWALNHPADKPDFHNFDCMAYQLRAASDL